MMDGGFARYLNNTDAFSRSEVLLLQQKSVAVVGCGGLGGYVIQCLARFGILTLTLIDGDDFSVSNLNRQLFATDTSLGKNKAITAQALLRDINPQVSARAVPTMMTPENARELLAGHDLVMDCLDNRSARLLLDDACQALGIPYVHGAIDGFYGQVSSVFPGDGTMQILCGSGVEAGKTHGAPAFTPQVVSGLQCSEALKILMGRGDILRNRLLSIDLLRNDFDVVDFY